MHKTPASLTGLFCDDIRQEVFGKVSLIGCYAGIMEVEEFPITLPKLCARVQIQTPMSERWTEAMVLKVLKDDEVVMEYPLPAPDERAEQENDEQRLHAITVHLAFSPFVIEKPCSIRIRGYVGEREMRGLGLIVRQNENLRGAFTQPPN